MKNVELEKFQKNAIILYVIMIGEKYKLLHPMWGILVTFSWFFKSILCHKDSNKF